MNLLLKTLVADGTVSVAVIDSTDMINDAIKIHGLSPLTAAALGRALTACTFMSSALKNQSDKLSITIAGDGVGGKITVAGNGNLAIRGVIDQPTANLPLRSDGKLDVGGCVGRNGRITVTRSMGLKEPYTGSAKLVSGEIAEDFAAYYAYSEQQPTALALGVKIGVDGKCVGAGGVMVQALPGANDEDLKKYDELVEGIKNISSLIEEKGARNVMKEFFGVTDADEYFPEYKCLCSREYIESVLVSLGKKEIDEIIEERGKVEVSCHFCNKTYVFDEKQANALFVKDKNE